MKKFIYCFVFFVFCLIGFTLFSGCDQTITRSLGGTTKVELEPGEKLVEATWKGDDIWYLVEPMDSNYTPKTKTFKESSRFGALEGKVIFIETR